jgi:outer membrane protein assembly factor BamD (BamD/ComL family)
MRLTIRSMIAVLAVSCLPLFSGCTVFNGWGSSEKDGALAAQPTPQASDDVALASYDADADMAGHDHGDDGLTLEDLYPSNISQTVRNLTGRGPDHDVARRLYGEGEQLYRQAIAERDQQDSKSGIEFEEASARFAEAAKRWPDSALEEDAIFRAAESMFFADKYVAANDLFESLLKKYPNTRYLDIVGARRFLIAEYWLQLERTNPRSLWQVNVSDDKRPWTDTHGHAVRIFDRMRLDDPTGKLADDATIAAANACLEQKDFVKADQYYSDLRKTFPSSEHQFMAHFLGLKAKLLSYRGPEYASVSLEEAEKLIQQIRRQFPQEAREHEEELERAYLEVRYRLAEREWRMAEFYDRRHEYGAARFYYDRIVDDFSDTPFVDKARDRVTAIAGEPPVPPQTIWLAGETISGNR